MQLPGSGDPVIQVRFGQFCHIFTILCNKARSELERGGRGSSRDFFRWYNAKCAIFEAAIIFRLKGFLFSSITGIKVIQPRNTQWGCTIIANQLTMEGRGVEIHLPCCITLVNKIKKVGWCMGYFNWFHSIRGHRYLNEKPFFPISSSFPAVLGF